MKKIIMLLALSLLFAGCVSNRPYNSVQFERIDSLKYLEGVYQNLAECGKDCPVSYLSTLIWPNTWRLDHASIVDIEVRLIDKGMLFVTAHDRNGVVKEDTFFEGIDFKFHSGRIQLKRKVSIMGFTPGDLILGPYYEKVDLGLDKKGDAKYSCKWGVAGLACAFIPFAIAGCEEVRFVKISN